MDKTIKEENIEIGYKIVKLCKNGFRSLSVDRERCFRIGKTHKPLKGWGPFGLFTTVKDCIEYIDTNPEHNVAIIKCVYSPSRNDDMWLKNSYGERVYASIYGDPGWCSSRFHIVLQKTRLAKWIRPIKMYRRNVSAKTGFRGG
jgi:hypothetical protein